MQYAKSPDFFYKKHMFEYIFDNLHKMWYNHAIVLGEEKMGIKIDINKVIEYRRQGKTLAEIAQLLGTNTTRIFKIKEELEVKGIDMSRGDIAQLEELDRKIFYYRNSELSVKQIAQKLKREYEHITVNLIHRRIRDMIKQGIQITTFDTVVDGITPRGYLIIKRLRHGCSYIEIAEELNIEERKYC